MTILPIRILAGAALAAALAPAAAQNTPVTFRADWTFKAVHAPVFLALERGYYAREGLDLQFLAGSGSANAVKSVASKSDTFGLADAGVLARAVGEGSPVKSIAVIQQGNPIAIAARSESVKSVKDLEGKVLVTTAATGPAQFFPLFARGAGIDPAKVTIANVAGNAQLSTFISGRGDAVTVYTNNELPLLQARTPDKTYTVFRYADFGVSLLNQAILAHTDTIAQHPEVVRKFLRATMKGYDDAVKTPAAAVDAFMKANPTADRALLEKQLAESLSLLRTPASQGKPIGWAAESDWVSTLDRLEKDLGMKPRLAPAAYYTNDLL